MGTTGGKVLEALEVAKKAIEVASDKLAKDILLLDTREVCSFADYFVICTCEAERQIDAISEEVDKSLKQEGVSLRHREGTVDSGWVLLDLNGVIVHLFAPQQRQYYNLDELWRKASTVVRIQ